jgi:ABC-type multidrug transport system permease subunit
MAFREKPTEEIRVDVVESSGFRVQGSANLDNEVKAELIGRLTADPRFKVAVNPEEDWKKRLQAGKTDLVIELHPSEDDSPYTLWDEPHRTESRLARYAFEAAVSRGSNEGVADTARSRFGVLVKHLDQPGSRYIDFLLPGLIGLNLMGGGMWGVGFVIVDMRVRKLLKRFLATPMRRSHFLLGVMLGRLFFTLTDIIILLVFGYLVFDVRCYGNYLELLLIVLLGGAAFAGIGLLVAARVQTIETVSGVMNFVMLPMWILSGVFFSSERFPTEIQPLINLLPLTAANQGLRGVMLDGKTLVELWPQAAILAGYTVITFVIALRTFRWR